MDKETTLVIGASLSSTRYSHKAIKRLVSKGFNVKAIGREKGVVEGVSIMNENKKLSDIDTVTLYINPKLQELYYDYVLSIKPRRVIFNPGTENTEFIALLKENNIQVEIACTLVLLTMNQY